MGNQKKCVIISSGDCMRCDVSDLVRDALVVCADGGINNAHKMGIAADVLIGDGDSMKRDEGVKYNTFIELPTEKDVTDTMACVSYALEQGCKEIHFLCCTGGRLDHLISNIFLLEYLHEMDCKGVLHDDFNEVVLLESGTHLVANDDKYKYLSLISLDRMASNVTLKNLKYSLVDDSLTRPFASLGVSNEFIGETAEITIGNGRCLLIRSRDRH